MPIVASRPPDQVYEAIRSKLSELAQGPVFRTKALSGVRTQNLSLTAPHGVFTLGLSEVVSGRDLSGARLTGWEYLIEQDNSVVASAEVALASSRVRDGSPQLTRGPYVQAEEKALLAAEWLPEVQRGKFELRLLRIPALYVMALWLRDTRGMADILLPLAPAPQELDTGRTYAPEEFVRALREPAKRLLVFDSAPESRSALGGEPQ